MTSSSPTSSSTIAGGSPSPQEAPVLTLSALPPVFVLPAHLAVQDLHELEDRLTEFGAQVTYSVAEAKLVLGKVGTKRRAAIELRSRRLYTDDVTPDAAEPRAKRQKIDIEATTDDEGGEVKDTVKVIKMEWLDDSLKAGKLLPLREYLVYEGKPVNEPPESSRAPASLPNPIRRGQSILERAEADEDHITANTHFSDRTFVSSTQSSRFPHHSTSKSTLLQQTTSDYEGEPSSDIPPPPDWVTQGLKYACQRSTPANPPNAAFIAQLKSIRLARTLTSDEVGVRAYSTAIAALAAYPYRITHPKEILQLPGCDAKIANLWIEWKNSGETTLAAVADAENDETLSILRTFYDIWGVGATTARDFHFTHGWRTLDDIIDHGWHTLTRVQQIGVKYYTDFTAGIPRPEVESIAATIHAHACALLGSLDDADVSAILVGGHRRGAPNPTDVDLILSHRDPAATAHLVDALVGSLERAGYVTHTLLLSLAGSARGQAPVALRTPGSGHGRASGFANRSGFDTLDKALVVWQDPDWPTRAADEAADPAGGARNPNPHRRVDIVVSPWRTVGCAVVGWSGGTTWERDVRRYAKAVKGWRFDSSGVRDRATGEVVWLEGAEGVEGGWEDAERRVFEGLGLEWRAPGERWTG